MTVDDRQPAEPGVVSYRVVFGVAREIEGIRGVVWTTVIQLADGTVDDGSRIESPAVHINIEEGEALTADQTRHLARLLIEAAEEVEQMSAGAA